jgi:hypothetical protein
MTAYAALSMTRNADRAAGRLISTELNIDHHELLLRHEI